jgi:hypothetical protein
LLKFFWHIIILFYYAELLALHSPSSRTESSFNEANRLDGVCKGVERSRSFTGISDYGDCIRAFLGDGLESAGKVSGSKAKCQTFVE